MTPTSTRQIRCPVCGLMRPFNVQKCACGAEAIVGFFEKEAERETK